MKGKLNAIELFIFGFTSIGSIISALIFADIFKIEEGAWYSQLWIIVKNLLALLFVGFSVGLILSFALGLPMRFFVNVLENKWKFNRNLWSSFIDDMKDVFPYNFISYAFMEVLVYPYLLLVFIAIVFILIIISSFYKIFLIDYGIRLSYDIDNNIWLVILSVILPNLFLFIIYKISKFLKINALKIILFLTGILIIMPNLYKLAILENVNEYNNLQLSMLVKLCFGVLLIFSSTLMKEHSNEERT
jgi:hypothetical protein